MRSGSDATDAAVLCLPHNLAQVYCPWLAPCVRVGLNSTTVLATALNQTCDPFMNDHQTTTPARSHLKTLHWTHCPGCGATDLESLGRYDTHEVPINVALCRQCGLVFVNPMLTDEAKAMPGPGVRRMHRSRSAELTDQRALERSRSRAGRWEYVIASQLKPGSRVLEIGSGDGAVVELLLKHGHHPVALDPDVESCRFLQRQFNIETIPSRLQDAPLQALKGFDAVFMLHLIEHLEDPAAALSRIGQGLDPGTLLAIETPNILRTKVGPKRMYSLPHNYYFSPVSLMQLVARQGFRPTHCRTFNLDMFHVVARRSADSMAALPDPGKNAAEVRDAILHHRRRYLLSGQFLLRKIPGFSEWYLYGRYHDQSFD